MRVRHSPARPWRRRVAAGMGMGRKAPVVNSVEVKAHGYRFLRTRTTLPTVWASRRSYTYSEGPPDLGVPEKLTFRWNHAYLVQNCAKNAIQTRKFWEKCTADCFF